jgi:hypothetical protein
MLIIISIYKVSEYEYSTISCHSVYFQLVEKYISVITVPITKTVEMPALVQKPEPSEVRASD